VRDVRKGREGERLLRRGMGTFVAQLGERSKQKRSWFNEARKTGENRKDQNAWAAERLAAAIPAWVTRRWRLIRASAGNSSKRGSLDWTKVLQSTGSWGGVTISTFLMGGT